MHLNTPGAGNVAQTGSGAEVQQQRPSIEESTVLMFCGWLAADLPELHAVHPQVIADSWEHFKAQGGQFLARNGEG